MSENPPFGFSSEEGYNQRPQSVPYLLFLFIHGFIGRYDLVTQDSQSYWRIHVQMF